MNNEELFRQALQRQHDRAARMKMPDDMEQRVMELIYAHKRKHWWHYAAVAASVAMILAIAFWPKEEAEISEQPVVEVKPPVVPKVEVVIKPQKTTVRTTNHPPDKRIQTVHKKPATVILTTEKVNLPTPQEDVCIDCEFSAMEDEMLAMVNEFENM
ncbi:MAG: hypothetical protein IJP82_01870 [Bacteroidaceae bacterium]|nr:hypothetical protein [Bacteroidaceae bacterium]